MMKNFLNPNIVDAFITAGQTMYHSTRNYATETTDYIWASLYSDDARTGNIMINNVLEAPEQETEFIYLLSNTNAYVSQNDLLQFVDEGNERPHTEKQNRYGAFALFSEDLTKLGAKIYATYYTTRKDSEWARANPDEVQQCYIMTGFYTATEDTLEIPWIKGLAKDLSQLNRKDCQSFGRNENGKGIGKSHAGSPKCLEVWRCSPSRRRNGWRFYSSGLPVPPGNGLNV